jgi:DNA-binding MarR family transcriptional regulator
MTPTQLAAREGVKIQSLTRLLAELEAEKRIKRKQHPVDGRQSVLSLTHSSLKILGSAALQAEQSLAQVIAIALTATEVAQLQSACLLLERLVHALPTGWADTALTAHKPHNTKE